MTHSAPEVRLSEIAARILAHLRRFESDPKTNKIHPVSKVTPYYDVNVHQGGGRVRVRYVSYQGTSSLTRTKAEQYLAWMDAGNIGRHYEFEKVIQHKEST